MASKQLVLMHPSNQQPLLVHLVLAEAEALQGKLDPPVKIAGVGAKNCPIVKLNVNPTVGETLFGEPAVASYLVKTYKLGHLAGADAFEEAEVQQWLAYASEGKVTEKTLGEIETHLSFRSYVVGHHLTLADLAVWASVRCGPLSAQVTADKFPHLNRFLALCSAIPHLDAVQKKHCGVVEKVQKKGDAFLSLKGNPKKGEVITRFPPEPSGYMHIGHCKAATLNHHYATSYEGKLVIRFDDTNPTTEKVEYADAILNDLKSLGITGQIYSHTSDHFALIIDHCEKLLKSGRFYVDSSTGDEIKLQRDNRVPSPFRDVSPEENLKQWALMKDGAPEGLKFVVRAKIEYASDNGCLRDPNVFRCVPNTPHPKTGTKYKVYPLYDFACPIVDSVEGVTHSLRSSEYHDRNPLYEWVLDACQLKHKPIIEDFSRLNFKYMILSKRKLNWFVQKGLVDGWDDPCFPTVTGSLRRGLTVEALRKFILQQGSSKNLNLMDMSKLWALNKQIIDPIIPRYTALMSDTVPFTLTDYVGGAEEVRTRDLHKKNASLGQKVVPYSGNLLLDREDADDLSVGEEVTLMDWGNVIIDKVEKADGKTVSLTGHLHLEGDFKSTKKKLTWLADVGKDLLPISLMECMPLLTKPKLMEGDNLEDFIPKKLKIFTDAVGEPALRLLKKGDKLQLERKGYFICDRPFRDFQGAKDAEPLLLILIPDGREKKEKQ